MSYRTFGLLLALASACFGAFRYFTGNGPWWQVPVLGGAGFFASYFVGFVIWVAVAPGDACGVGRELLVRLCKGKRDV